MQIVVNDQNIICYLKKKRALVKLSDFKMELNLQIASIASWRGANGANVLTPNLDDSSTLPRNL